MRTRTALLWASDVLAVDLLYDFRGTAATVRIAISCGLVCAGMDDPVVWQGHMTLLRQLLLLPALQACTV